VCALRPENAATVGGEHPTGDRQRPSPAVAQRSRSRRHGHGAHHRNGHALRALWQWRHQPSPLRGAQCRGCGGCRLHVQRLPVELSRTKMTSTLQATLGRIVEAAFAAESDFLAEMVKVPTDNPPGGCAPHAARTRSLLEAMGLQVEAHPVPADSVRAAGMISATNLIVRQRFGNGGPCSALKAHGDVVPPGLGWSRNPYGAEVVNDPVHGLTMYGRGVAVSKSDFATYTYALRALQELARGGHALNGSVELHFTYDEEVGGEIGPRWLLVQGLTRPDYVICAGFSVAVTAAHNGCLHLEVTVRGKQGHAAMPESGVDALAATAGILTSIYDSRETLKTRRSRVTGITHPTVNVGLIEGGINTNVVPDRVTFRIDRRMIPEEDPKQAELELRGIIERAAAGFTGIRVEIRRILLALPL